MSRSRIVFKMKYKAHIMDTLEACLLNIYEKRPF